MCWGITYTLVVTAKDVSRVLNQELSLQTVGTIIRINFIFIDIELDAACRWDYIQFTSPGESPDKHCGDEQPSILRFFLSIWVDYFIKLVTVDLCWLSSLPMGHKEFSLLLNLH